MPSNVESRSTNARYMVSAGGSNSGIFIGVGGSNMSEVLSVAKLDVVMGDVTTGNRNGASTEFRHRILENRSGGLQTAEFFGWAVWKAPFLEVPRRIHAAIQGRAPVGNRPKLHFLRGVQGANKRLKRGIGAGKSGPAIVSGLRRINRRQGFCDLPYQRTGPETFGR